jgi:hypothetical protein
MNEVHLINQFLNWERRLESEEGQRKNHRFEDVFSNRSLQMPSVQTEHNSAFAQLFGLLKEKQTANPRFTQDPCRETQIG